MNFIPPQDEGRLRAAASGVLPNGKAVVVNSDGTVSSVSQSSFTESLGSDVTFNAANTADIASAFDSTNNKVVVAYRDNGNSSYGHARVGTVDSSDNSISWGTEVTFRSSSSQYISACFDSANGKIVIAYQDAGDSFKGKAIVGTVSGTDISFGSSVEFQSGETTWINAVYDTSTSKVVIVYRNSGGDGKAIVGTVSGTSISFGSIASTGHGALQGTAVYHAAASRIVAAGKVDNSTANAVVGAVSGTSISFGSAVAYGTSSAQKNNNKIAYDSASEKVVVFYRDEGVSGYGRASVGTVDASDNSIAFATAVTVTTDSVDMVGVQGFSSGGQIIFLYSDTTNTKGDLKVGTISGTTLSVGSELNVRNGGNTNYWGLCEDTTNDRIVIAYEGASSHGISNVYNPAFSRTNVTAENYIGMSGGAVDFDPQVIGSQAVFEAGSTSFTQAVFDSNSNKVVFAYRDIDNSNRGTAIVGTIDAANNTISFGSSVAFTSGAAKQFKTTFDTNANKVIIAYRDEGNSNYGTGIVGTISGTSISFGTAAVFNSATTNQLGLTFDSNSNKAVVAYRDGGNGNDGFAKVATVSGTDVSYGSGTEFIDADATLINAAFDSNANKVVITFSNGGGVIGSAIVGTVSGTSISFGTAATFNNASTYPSDCVFDSTSNKIVVVFEDGGNSSYGTAVVGTVSGTSISFGAETVFTSNNIGGTEVDVTFDSNLNKVIVVYADGGASKPTTAAIGTVSGTTITFADPVVIDSGNNLSYFGVAFDTNSNRTAIGFSDANDSNKGTALVFKLNNTTRGQVASGSSASVDIIGTISENQNALTAGQSYFVQTDGTIGLTAGSPSVFAGTAISATKLLVKT